MSPVVYPQIGRYDSDRVRAVVRLLGNENHGCLYGAKDHHGEITLVEYRSLITAMIADGYQPPKKDYLRKGALLIMVFRDEDGDIHVEQIHLIEDPKDYVHYTPDYDTSLQSSVTTRELLNPPPSNQCIWFRPPRRR
jgi:hypothetical protein